nr:hypothetical protein [Tanacetum cinerariifolium]
MKIDCIKQAQIEQDEAYARELEAELNKNINWDDVIEQVKTKEKKDNAVLRYQALNRKPQTEAQAKKNMMLYLKNMAGFKMDFFKVMRYDAIRPIFEKIFNSVVGFLEKSKEELKKKEAEHLRGKVKVLKRMQPRSKSWMKSSSLEESKRHSWFSKNQKLEIVSVLWRSHYNVYNQSDHLAGREKISLDKTYCCWYKLMLLDNAADSRLRLLEQSAAIDDKMKKYH